MTERYQQIQTAAGNILVEEGYRGFTTKKLAQKAEVSEGLIFKYFGSIETLFQTIVDQSLRTIFAVETNSFSGDRKTKLILALSSFLSKISEHDSAFQLYVATQNERPDILSALDFSVEKSSLYRFIHKNVTEEIGDQIEADELIMDIIFGTLFRTLQRTSGERNIQPASYATLLIHILFNGLK